MSELPPAKTLVIVATYNEIDNLPLLVEQIQQQLPHADLLIIDDNSPDGTGRWCDARSAQDHRLKVLHRPGKLGLGSATMLGFHHAVTHGYEVALTMDADFSHDPVYLPRLYRRLLADETPPVEVVIGSRYVAGGGIRGWPPMRRWMSRFINVYARWSLGLTVQDCSGAFRAYRVSTLQRLDLRQVRSSGYAYLEELLWRLQASQARMEEVPILFVDRVRGETKINWREAVTAGITITRLGWQRPSR